MRHDRRFGSITGILGSALSDRSEGGPKPKIASGAFTRPKQFWQGFPINRSLSTLDVCESRGGNVSLER
jgi:hypothetical protein